MPTPSPLDSEVYVIRMWRENGTGSGTGTRRGYIEYIATGERRYFSELRDVLEFVTALGARPRTVILGPPNDDATRPA